MSAAPATAAIAEPAAPADVEEIKVSYWSLVWGQLKKNKLAVFGLCCIALLVLVAVYAPLITLNKPIRVAWRGTVEWPLFACLFDRNFFENGVDVFFNLAMVLSPLYLLAVAAYKLAARRLGVRAKRQRAKLLLGMLAFHFAAFGLVSANPRSIPYRDWPGEIRAACEAGEAVRVVWPLFTHSYRDVDLTTQHPKAPDRGNLLGTDKEGRDVFARMVYGTRISLTIGIVGVAIYEVIGVILGALAGYFGGAVDIWISRLIEVMICFPTFFLILTLAAFIEKRSIFHVMAIIGLTSWTGVARLVRAEFLKLKNLDYAQAAVALGIARPRVIFGHLLPNAIGPVLVSATFGIASAILVESSLAFLGLGDLSAPSWGQILAVGRQEMKLWLILAPGAAIFVVVSLFNLVGEGLRDALDPKLRR